MDLLHATILGIVEGLTEFLPVSSTGHLVLVGHWLGLGQGADKEALDAFDIVVQAGAWLACVLYYIPLLQEKFRAAIGPDPVPRQQARSLILAVAAGFVPIAIIGKLFGKVVKAKLFHPTPIAIALVVGGVVMIVAERLLRNRGRISLQDMNLRTGLAIGTLQCAALVPGTSRSMATIVGGLVLGLDVKAAADFSFLLAIPVLGAATGYEVIKSWHALMNDIGPEAITVGLIASFLTGLAAIAFFLKSLKAFGLTAFGIYRIALGAIVWLTLR